MRKHWMFLLIGFFIMILSACGQGNASNEENQQADPVVMEETIEVEEETVDTDIEEEAEPVKVDTNVEETNETDEEAMAESNKTMVTLIFSDDDVMEMYLEDREIEATGEAVYKATLEAWIAGPTKEGLTSLVSTDVEVQSVEIINDVAHVSFSETLLDTQVGSGTEFMLLQQIAMAMSQFGFNETQILIDGETYPELFGHVDTNEPVVAEPLENYGSLN